jgi:hypothetical protein
VPVTVDVEDYRALFRKTRTVDRDINRELKKRMRAAGKIGADAARAKIREWPVSGGISSRAGGRAHRGLRATLSSHIRVSATGRTVLIRQGRQGLTGRSSADLPRDIDRGGWRHPTFGHHASSVFQTGWPYFKMEIASKYQPMVDEVSKVLDDIARRIA